jgi:hypothetical protein
MAQYYNLAIDQGTDFSVTITANDSTGSARVLTGYTGNAQIKRSYYSSTGTYFGINIAAANGQITLTLSNAQTANLKYGRYVYDLELTKTSANTIERIIEGTATIYPQVTK